jgi:hypothetical protein
MELDMTGEYWVFKYVEDLARQEPRNIGVVLRIGDGIYARFIGERENGQGGLDLRTVRSIVSHTGAYKQWVDYWRYSIQHATTAGQALDLLVGSAKGNYVVGERSSVSLPEVHPLQALSHLFHSLVTEFPTPRVEERSLAARVQEIIQRYDLKESPFFQESPSVTCEIQPGVIEHVRPNYGWVNGRALYFQRVSISPYRLEPTQKDVHNAAWIFEKLRAAVPGAETKALVKVMGAEGDTEADAEDARRQTDEYLALLTRISNGIINVDDDAEVHGTFGALAHH